MREILAVIGALVGLGVFAGWALAVVAMATERPAPDAKSLSPAAEESAAEHFSLVVCLGCSELMEHQPHRWFCGSCWGAVPLALKRRVAEGWRTDRDGETQSGFGTALEASCEYLRRRAASRAQQHA